MIRITMKKNSKENLSEEERKSNYRTTRKRFRKKKVI